MEAVQCDDWLVASFTILNKIIFTTAIKRKKTPNSRSCRIFYVKKETALLTALRDKSFTGGRFVLVWIRPWRTCLKIVSR